MRVMRSVLLLISLFFVFTIQAQIPQGINYQAIIRDAGGVPLPKSTNVTVEFIIKNANSENYNQTQTTTVSNDFGLVNLVIGKLDEANLAAFDWSATPCTIEVKANNVSLGTQTMVSVPYAFRCGSVVGGGSPWTENAGDVFRTTGNVGIGTNAPDYTLDVAGDVGIDEYLRHNGDVTTFLRMKPQTMTLTAGKATILAQTDNFDVSYSGETFDVWANSTLLLKVKDVLTLSHYTENFSDPSLGLGTGILFKAVNTNKEMEEIARIAAIYDKSADAAEYGFLSFQTRENAGPLKETMRLGYSGDLTLPYLAGAGTATVEVDASGRLVRGGAVSTSLWTQSGANVSRVTGGVNIGAASGADAVIPLNVVSNRVSNINPVAIFESVGTGSSSSSIQFKNNTIGDVRIGVSASGSFGIHFGNNVGTTGQPFSVSPAGNVIISGYTKLGSDAPAIKMKVFETTSPSTEGGLISVLHGLNSDKIVSLTALCNYGTGLAVPAEYSKNPGYCFSVYVANANITVFNHISTSPNNGSLNILSKPMKITVFYYE